MKRHHALAIAAACAAAQPLAAHAHHLMGGVVPATAFQGFVSGLAHPVIGLDHFVFVLAMGAACYAFGQRLPTIVAFLAAALVGTMLHVQRLTLPYAELWVAATLLLLGVALLRAAPVLRSRIAPALFALAGLVHGYAYGESIVGAEPTPLFAYLLGFTLIQLAVAVAGFLAARQAARMQRPAMAMNALGATASVAGIAFGLAALVA